MPTSEVQPPREQEMTRCEERAPLLSPPASRLLDQDMFENVPDEIRQRIAAFLLPSDVASLASTSRGWWNTLSSPESWRTLHDRYDSHIDAPLPPKLRGCGSWTAPWNMRTQGFTLASVFSVGVIGMMGGAFNGSSVVSALAAGACWGALGGLEVQLLMGCPFIFSKINERARSSYEAQQKRYTAAVALQKPGQDAAVALEEVSSDDFAARCRHADALRKSALMLQQHGQARVWQQAYQRRDTAALIKLLDGQDFRLHIDAFSPPAYISDLINTALRQGKLARATRLLDNGGALQEPDARGLTPEQATKEVITARLASGNVVAALDLRAWLSERTDVPAQLDAAILYCALQRENFSVASKVLAANTARNVLDVTAVDGQRPREIASRIAQNLARYGQWHELNQFLLLGIEVELPNACRCSKIEEVTAEETAVLAVLQQQFEATLRQRHGEDLRALQPLLPLLRNTDELLTQALAEALGARDLPFMRLLVKSGARLDEKGSSYPAARDELNCLMRAAEAHGGETSTLLLLQQIATSTR